MSDIPQNLLYSKEDEWILVEDGVATIGITDYAQDALSDIVYLELPDVGDTLEAGGVFGVVESVKAASDLFAPLAGDVTAANEELLDTPETLNEDPYTAGWLIKMTVADESQLTGLMDAAAYTAYCEER